MQLELRKYIETHNLCSHDDSILVAVSGGIDSLVLLDLMLKESYNCAIAHCNFQLRGEESNQDQKFVQGIGARYGIKVHLKSFDTKAYAVERGISTQMAARDLRYEWFMDLMDNHGYNCTAIAHNSDDSIETFHLNLARGTGLSGITGISPKNDRIIRPLLWASRNEISKYCNDNNLAYREDSSNLKTDYKRNFIRHEILPNFLKINPSYPDAILKSQENFRQSSVMLDYFYNELIRKSGLLSKNGSRISVELLKELPEPSWFLFRYLTPYGFTSSQIIDIYESLDSDPGRQFFSESHILVRDREYLLLSENMELDRPELLIEESRGKLTKPVTLEWKTIDADKIEIEKSSGTASLDFDKLKFPLSLRPWRSGDSFFPFGMNRRKKLSDFFIDQKLSLLDKRNIWLLTSEDQIVWIIGHRIDNRFRISPQTKMVFRIQATT